MVRKMHQQNPASCQNNIKGPYTAKQAANAGKPGGALYAWTDLTYLLHKYHVSWNYYLDQGAQPDCADDQMICTPPKQKVNVPGIWNPLPGFVDVKQDNQIGNIQPVQNFITAAKHGTLPSVSWVVPNSKDSEHPPALVSTGQAYVTNLINSVMQGPDWSSSAIFLAGTIGGLL